MTRRSDRTGRFVWRMLAVLALLVGPSLAWSAELCTARTDVPQIPADPALCTALDPVVRHPEALPLADYEAQLGRFLRGFCHRREDAGWVPDKTVRDSGPFIAAMHAGQWTGQAMGTHGAVLVWYSPEMVAWLRRNRGEPAAAAQEAVPDGAMMIKEMYPGPAAACRDVPVAALHPVNGAAVMVRATAASQDGWFWGWFGWDVSKPDFPPTPGNGLPDMGFGQYCVNCHASARSGSTFASLGNVKGEPGTYQSFLSQHSWMSSTLAGPPVEPLPKLGLHEAIAIAGDLGKPPQPDSRAQVQAYLAALGLPGVAAPAAVAPMPSATYDTVWMPAGAPSPHGQFVTSDQCVGCHSAGTTGLQFDMTAPWANDTLLNLSPYGTWRSSPMGLAGRDPVFFAQLASETERFHPGSAAMIQQTCLGCHAVQGERQFAIDGEGGGSCQGFTRAMLDAVPWPAGNAQAGLAKYGALGRDGVSCVTCHRMALGAAAQAARGEPQNRCVAARQALLNPGATGLAATFTGSFLQQRADRILGPFADPKLAPMRNALGVVAAHDPATTSSEVCATCHSVHLPVLRDGAVLGQVFEQSTYAEWAFSAYRTGSTPDGPLPGGAGPLAESCQGCHMPSHDAQGAPVRSKIASIQEVSNFPRAENSLPPEEIDLPVREGYATHLLVGLNLFLVKMAAQFPDLLGTASADPMLTRRGASPTVAAEQAMVDQALHRSVAIGIDAVSQDAGTLHATVRVRNLTGHRFPSGVGFRRAFLAFEVLDARGEVIWASGRTNPAGVLTDAAGAPVAGERWWTDDCSARLDPAGRAHQPHRRVIDRQDQVEIYEELVAAPPDTGPAQCGRHAAPAGPLTTSFLSLCAPVKDDRLLPQGYLPRPKRVAIAQALGAGAAMADDTEPLGLEGDPDFRPDGTDTVRYDVTLSGLAAPASVRATMYYQATPPYFLQDRVCTSASADTHRLTRILGGLQLQGSQASGWKMRLASTGPVPVPPGGDGR